MGIPISKSQPVPSLARMMWMSVLLLVGLSGCPGAAEMTLWSTAVWTASASRLSTLFLLTVYSVPSGGLIIGILSRSLSASSFPQGMSAVTRVPERLLFFFVSRPPSGG